MKLFAVTGKPVFFSRSPSIHNRLFTACGQDAYYSRLRVDSISELAAVMRSGLFAGLNVTAPFKEEAVSVVDSLDQAATRIGAINTVCRRDTGNSGYNTDSAGVMEALKASRIKVKGRSALVLGAGGAARAALDALTGAGCLVTVINRTREGAARCAYDFRCIHLDWGEMRKALEMSTLVVNATPSPEPIFPMEWLRPGTVVFDADYRHRSLEKAAASRGCAYLGGEQWLFHQALEAFKIFSGARPAAPDIFQVRRSMESAETRDKRLVSLIGLMGCGKSTLAPLLAEMLGYSALDADTLIEQSVGMTIERFFREKGEEEFRRLERELVKELLGRERTVIAWGGGVVLSAESRKLMRRNSHVVWLHVPPDLIRRRIGSRGRPLLHGQEGVARIERLFAARKGLYGATADLVIVNDKDPKEVSHAIKEEIGPFCDN